MVLQVSFLGCIVFLGVRYFLNLNVCFIFFLIYVGCFLWLFVALFIYLKRRALKKRTYSYQKFKYLDGFVRIVIDILAILMIGMLFVLKMNNLSSLLSFWVILY